jgi:hypothetical protein
MSCYDPKRFIKELEQYRKDNPSVEEVKRLLENEDYWSATHKAKEVGLPEEIIRKYAHCAFKDLYFKSYGKEKDPIEYLEKMLALIKNFGLNDPYYRAKTSARAYDEMNKLLQACLDKPIGRHEKLMYERAAYKAYKIMKECNFEQVQGLLLEGVVIGAYEIAREVGDFGFMAELFKNHPNILRNKIEGLIELIFAVVPELEKILPTNKTTNSYN